MNLPLKLIYADWLYWITCKSRKKISLKPLTHKPHEEGNIEEAAEDKHSAKPEQVPPADTQTEKDN